jgi:hypothetical protein
MRTLLTAIMPLCCADAWPVRGPAPAWTSRVSPSRHRIITVRVTQGLGLLLCLADRGTQHKQHTAALP